ncbi:MAG: hypothetical protein LQ341_004523, partial [Variospora aurantia]
VDHYPAEDEKLRASSIVRRRGGNCPNTVEVFQQLLDLNKNTNPVSLALCAVLPSKSSSGYQEIKASFAPVTDLTRCICREDNSEPASSYIIRSRAVDSRTIINYNGLREMSLEEFASVADELGERMGYCHFEVRSCGFQASRHTEFQGRIPDVTRGCIQHLRHNHPNVKISVEVEKHGREGLQGLAVLADVVFYSKSWAQGNGYKSAEECLHAQATLTSNASLLLCTWGESGASALELPSRRYVERPAYKTMGAKVVDTVGAGDTFIAGILFGLTCHTTNWTVDRQLEFANELAGRKVVQEGLRGLGNLVQHFF